MYILLSIAVAYTAEVSENCLLAIRLHIEICQTSLIALSEYIVLQTNNLSLFLVISCSMLITCPGERKAPGGTARSGWSIYA